MYVVVHDSPVRVTPLIDGDPLSAGTASPTVTACDKPVTVNRDHGEIDTVAEADW